MKTLLNEVAALSKSPNWESIGYALGLGEAVINRIRGDRPQSLDGFVGMFEEWVKNDSQRTWRKVLNALRTEHVGEHALAYNLEHKLLGNLARVFVSRYPPAACDICAPKQAPFKQLGHPATVSAPSV